MSKRKLPVLPDGFTDPALPAGTGGHFSASQYGLYKKCPKAYEFRYVLGVKRPPSALALKGTVVHAGAEAAHLHVMEHKAPPPVEQITAVVSDVFDATKGEIETWEDATPGAIKDDAVAAYRVYHRQGLPRVNPVAVEHAFAARVGTVPVIGYIDLIDHVRGPARAGVEDPGKRVVADLKVSSSSWSQADLDKDPQFTLYTIVTGVPAVRVDNLVSLSKGTELKQKESLRDPHAQRILVEDLEETVDLIKRGVFPKTAIDSWACSPKWCGYWAMCRGRTG